MRTPINNWLLSHHPDSQLSRCVVVSCGQRSHYVCARCTGGVAGVVWGVMLLLLVQWMPAPAVLLLALPDWLLATSGIWQGNNLIRIITGHLLGVLYVVNWYELLRGGFPPDLWVINGIMLISFALGSWFSHFRMKRANRRDSVSAELNAPREDATNG